MSKRQRVEYEDLRSFVRRHRAEMEDGRIWLPLSFDLSEASSLNLELWFIREKTSIVLQGTPIAACANSTTPLVAIDIDQPERTRVMRRIWTVLEGNTAPDSRRQPPTENHLEIQNSPSSRDSSPKLSPEPSTMVEFSKLPPHEQSRLALKGGPTSRQFVIRRKSIPLIRQLLQNPSLTDNEILAISKLREMTCEILEKIADNKQWMTIDGIGSALLENPSTPVPLAIRIIPTLDHNELHRLYRKRSLRPSLESAVRRILNGR